MGLRGILFEVTAAVGIFFTFGREMSCTGPFSPMDRLRSVDSSSALGSDMALARGSSGVKGNKYTRRVRSS